MSRPQGRDATVGQPIYQLEEPEEAHYERAWYVCMYVVA